MSSRNLKEKHFKVACAALGNIFLPSPDGYVCPICVRLFRDLSDLSLEHVPPRSRGGKGICLTCKGCNSTAGHTVDVAAHRDLSLKRFLARGADGERSKLKIDSLELNVDVRRDGKGVHVSIPGEINPPETVEASKPAFEKAIREGLAFTLSKTVKMRQFDADVGYLRSAYLAAFAKLGYRWALASQLNRVRKQIAEPTVKHLRNFRIYVKQDMPHERGMYLLSEPITCLLVTEKRSVIVLPWIDSPKQDIYDWFGAQKSNAPSMTFSVSDGCSWPSRLELRLDRLPLSDT